MKIEIKDGVVTNDGAELGAIKDGTCHLTMQCAPVIKGEIRKVTGMPELKFLVGEAPDAEDEEGKDGVEGNVDLIGAAARGLGGESASPPLPPVESNPSDPKPARDMIRGDKCPLLIAWTARQSKKGGK
jgi:hypothetical protein